MPCIVRHAPDFLAEVAEAEINHPGSKRMILEFLDNRKRNPVWQGYGAKDARLKGKLDDTWHVHIVHGTVLLFYGISETSLDAYCLRDHTHVDTTPKQKAFRKVIDTFLAGQFVTFDVDAALRPPVPVVRMSQAERSSLEDIIFDLLASEYDRSVVDDAAVGIYDDFRIYVSILAGHAVEPLGFWDAILAEFGGDASFRSWLKTAASRVSRGGT